MCPKQPGFESQDHTMWSLYVNRGKVWQHIASRAGPDQIKAAARDEHQQRGYPAHAEYRIYSPNGLLRYTSSHNTNWRMRWKKARKIEYLAEITGQIKRQKTA